jgi:hypothetical protein
MQNSPRGLHPPSHIQALRRNRSMRLDRMATHDEHEHLAFADRALLLGENEVLFKENPKIVLDTCDHCKRKEQKHSWLKDHWANLSRPFWIGASKHTSCEICQNYRVEEDQPLRIIPLF